MAIYDFIFSLQPLPPGKPAYELVYESVDDEGALDNRQLRSRRRRENASLRAFLSGDLIRRTRLAEVHQWLYLQHSGYTAAGYLSKKPLEQHSALAGSY